jgi:multidrug efflux pump subunit AcrA (membrane-fusion protein)
MKKILFALALIVPMAILSLGMTARGDLGLHNEPSTIPGRSGPPSHEQKSIQGMGFVEPVTEVRKLVFKVDVVIARCPAEIGRTYKKGDVLMELDNREQLASIAVAEAEWKLAESERDAPMFS